MSSNISIILPVFNGERYIKECIDSILNQTILDFDLIIVDDASRDNTLTIVNKFLEREVRIKVIRNDVNMKLPEALNRGFATATGKWVTWISHDNVLERDFLEIMVNAAEDQNADCVYSDYKIINSEGEVTGISHMKPIHEIGYGNCVGASFLYKLEAHRALGGFDRNKFLFEDYDYWVRMNSLGYKMIYIAEFPYRYRIHSQQLSSTHIYPRSLVKYRWKLAQSSTFIDPVRKSELIYSIIGLSIRTRSFDLTFLYFLVSIRYWKKIFLRLRERKRRSIQ